jgi:hypothetical protein
MNKLIARSYVVCPAGIRLKGTFGVWVLYTQMFLHIN